MKDQPSKIALSAFLITVVSTTEMPAIFKYLLLLVAIVSIILEAYRYYKEWKTKRTFTKSN
jgi:uncharacterized membrane protein